MNTATVESLLKSARYFYQDAPRETQEGCVIETRWSAADQIDGEFVGVVEFVTLSAEGRLG